MALDYAEFCRLLGVRVQKKILPPQAPNIPVDRIAGGDYGWEHITVHDTANQSRGANALMHWRFVKGGGGKDHVSFTFAVDSEGVVQILDLDQVNYAQGTVSGNWRSISIEMCINSDGDWTKTVDNTAALVAALRAAGGKGRSAVKQHHYWYGKDCPGRMRHTPGGWEAFVGRVDEKVRRLIELKREEEGERIGDYLVREPFLSLWKKHGLAVMGYPMGEPYTEVEEALGGRSAMYQDFENVVAQWYEGLGEARIAAGVRKYKYGK